MPIFGTIKGTILDLWSEYDAKAWNVFRSLPHLPNPARNPWIFVLEAVHCVLRVCGSDVARLVRAAGRESLGYDSGAPSEPLDLFLTRHSFA